MNLRNKAVNSGSSPASCLAILHYFPVWGHVIAFGFCAAAGNWSAAWFAGAAAFFAVGHCLYLRSPNDKDLARRALDSE